MKIVRDVDGLEVTPGHFGYIDYDTGREWWVVDKVDDGEPMGPCITCIVNGRGLHGQVCGRDHRYNLRGVVFVGPDNVPDEVLALVARRQLVGDW